MMIPSPAIGLSPRLRSTPFTKRVEEAGVSSYTVYNHMLLPTSFASLEADYVHLKNAVQIWDVACERQIEVTGPDAGWLVQMLTPRDLSNLEIGKCYLIAPTRIEKDSELGKQDDYDFFSCWSDYMTVDIDKGIALGEYSKKRNNITLKEFENELEK